MSANRDAIRVNMFIAASLFSRDEWRPVRVRNLSTHGALIDAGFDLPIGSSVMLRRGGLGAEGNIIWVKGGRLGVRLITTIHPTEWLAPAKNPKQEDADRAFALARTAATTPTLRLVRNNRAVISSSRVGTKIEQAIFLLTEIGDQLGNDIIVVRQHTTVLQNLDLAVQILQRLHQVPHEQPK